MKQIACLFLLLVFTTNPLFSQQINEIHIYKIDDETQEFKLSTKQIFDYDLTDHDRMERLLEMRINPETGAWDNHKLLLKDYNEQDHLQKYHFAIWQDHKWNYYSKREYYINYSDDGSIVAVSMDDYSDTAKKDIVNYKLKAFSHLVEEFKPLSVSNTPDYLLEHGENMIFDENQNLLSASLERCKEYKYDFEYDENGLPLSFKKFQMNDYGDYFLKEKGRYIYDQENEIEERTETEITEMTIFPNPSRDYIHIVLSQSLKKGEYLLINNAFGEVVDEVHFPEHKLELQVDLTTLNSGIYFINSNLTLQAIGAKVIKID